VRRELRGHKGVSTGMMSRLATALGVGAECERRAVSSVWQSVGGMRCLLCFAAPAVADGGARVCWMAVALLWFDCHGM
jgi:hypothetical protein